MHARMARSSRLATLTLIGTTALALTACSKSTGSTASSTSSTSSSSSVSSATSPMSSTSTSSSADASSGSTGTPSAGSAASSSGGGAPAGTIASVPAGAQVAVTLITKTSTNPYFIAMQKGAQAQAAKDNVKLTLAAGKQDGDEDTQISAIEDAIARGDKGILITPNGNGVNSAIKKARDAGLYVIALDTVPDPADTVDITFATNNFLAGEDIGKWTAAQLGGKDATIAMLDLFNDKVVTVDTDRDQGFLTGLGVDVKDKTKNGDEDKTGKYTGGKGGNYTIVCNEPTQGAQDGGKTAMENCLSKNPNINVVYTINEPAAAGAADALGSTKAIIVSIDGGCDGVANVKKGVIGATSQQYPLRMASDGVDAIATIARGGAKPTPSAGLGFFNTGVSLVTDTAVPGLDSITSDAGSKICWG